MWLNMRLQEKETINGIPKLLWSKLPENSQKEYLQKWKDFVKSNPNQRNHERNINLVEALNDFQEQNDDIETNMEDEEVHSVNNTRMILEVFPDVITTIKNWRIDFPTPHIIEGKVSIKNVQVARSFKASTSEPHSIMDNGADTSVIGHG